MRSGFFKLSAFIAISAFFLSACEAVVINGRVWLDANGDGIQDSGEGGAAGVTLQLLRICSSPCIPFPVDSKVTGSDGTYSFGGLEPAATYLVKLQSAPFSFDYSPLNATTDEAKDSDVLVASGLVAGLIKPSEADATHMDIGVITLKSTIRGRVWLDANGDGVQDGGEGGAAGVTLQLMQYTCVGTCSFVPITTQVTGSDGTYSFAGLNPTGTYFVNPLSVPFSFEYSPVNATDDDRDSDVLVASGLLAGLIKPSEPDASHMDIGLRILKSAISGRVWLDANGDGVQDSGEAGAAGVTLQLMRSTCAGTCSFLPVDAKVTGSDGSYSFVGLEPTGTYIVTVLSAPFPFAYSPLNATTDEARDSDVLVASGIAGGLIKPSETDASHWDIGLVTSTSKPSATNTATLTPTPTATTTPTITNTPRPLPTYTFTPQPTREKATQTPCGPNGCPPTPGN